METLLIINALAFLAVTAYAIFLFVQIVRTRIAYIKLGRKTEFDEGVKQRLKDAWVYVFGQKKLLKDKKSGAIHVMFFYGFILVQFGAIDFIWAGLVPGSHLPLGFLYPGFKFFQEIVALVILFAVLGILSSLYRKTCPLEEDFCSGSRILLYRITNDNRFSG